LTAESRWFREEAFGQWPSDEAERDEALPQARLDPLILQAMEIPNNPFQLYSTWEQAIKNLAKVRALLQEPQPKKPSRKEEQICGHSL
jgi:hypothetical protein